MCVFFLLLILDSSPKSSTAKNIHLLSRETIQDTVNMLSTPPTRRNRFINNQNVMNDDSPILSQESINISWKWNNEGTPVRSTSKVSKLRQRSNNSPMQQQLQHLKRLTTKKRIGGDSPNGLITEATSTVVRAGSAPATTSTPTTTMTTAAAAATNGEPENNSPKGLYKFQEEMRKIQFDLESDTSCDNNDKSMTVADTGYPINADQLNANISDSNFDIEMDDNYGQAAASAVLVHQTPQLPPTPPAAAAAAALPTSQKSTTHDDDVDLAAHDLFNDSDFDQILLTCQIPAQPKSTTSSKSITTNFAGQSTSSGSQMSVKKASSAPEIKTQNSNSDSSGSNWNLVDDDCFDDLVKDFDVDIPSDALNTSASKFIRHKSMPHPQPQTSTSTAISSASTISKPNVSMAATTALTSAATPQHKQSNVYAQNNFSRKSFTRHESMPISNNSTTINRFSIGGNTITTNNNNSSMRPNSSM